MKVLHQAVDAYHFVKAYSQHLPLAVESIFAIPCTVATLQGTLKSSGEQVTLLYVGRRRNYVYLLRTIFDTYREVEIKNSNLLSFRKHMDRMAETSDVVVVDIGWPYNGLFNRRGEYLEIPDWVNMAVELPGSWEEIVRSFRHTTRNNDLRLIRRNGYRCEVTRKREAIEEFYDRMYVPFVSHKHAADSTVAPRKLVLRRAAKGQLLQVLSGDEIVAAGVIYPQNGILYFLWMGLPAQHVESPPEAAISALYFFGIRHAFDNGCKVVDFTGTRAFLSDGAFRFKRKWGALVDDTFSPSSILIRPKNGRRQAAIFCEHFPVLARGRDGLNALFVCRQHAGDEATCARLRKEYGCDGVESMTIIKISDKNETRFLPNGTDECQCRVIHTPLDGFADHYVGRASGGQP